jgi:hypothetical protein
MKKKYIKELIDKKGAYALFLSYYIDNKKPLLK